MFDQAWPDVSLEELFTINTDGVAPNAAPHTEFHHHSLPAWDVSGGPSVEKGLTIESNKTRITKSCVLVSKLNPRKPRVSVVETVPEGEHHCASTEFVCLEPKSEEPLNFWGHLFSNKSFSENLDRIAIGSTNSHKRFSPKALLSQKIELPPEPERKLIAHILDTLDTQIQKTEALIAKLERVKEGLLHDLLTRGIDENGHLRPSPEQAPELYKESPLGLIPREWSVSTLGQRLSQHGGLIQTGPFGSQLHAEEYVSEGIPVVMPQDMRDIDVSRENIAQITEERAKDLSRHRVAESDLLFSRRGDLSRCSFMSTSNKGWLCGTGCLLLRPADSMNGYWLASIYKQPGIQSQVYGMAVGSTMVNLNSSILANIVIPIPALHEQNLVVEAIRSSKRKILDEKKSLNKMKVKKSGLMDDLLTGRVRVTPLLDQAKNQAQATPPA